MTTLAVTIFRSSDYVSDSYELRLSLDHLSTLAKKGEIMDKMTMFNKTMFNNKEESKGPTALSPAPIQDEKGNLTFELVGKTFFLNVNSEEERERVKEEVNANSLTKYDWFKEKTGEKHWVLYNTEMYEIVEDVKRLYLHYKEDSNLTPIIPINATSCYSMFEECSKHTSFDLSNFDTSKVTNMSYMFYNCSNLTSLDFSNCNTSKVTSIHWMFCNCSKLVSLDLSSFSTSKVTDMSYMFCNCKSLTTLDLSNFDTSKVTDMRYMFCGCLKLTSLDLSSFDTSNVTYMRWMFKGCSSLTQLDLSNFDTSKVTKMYEMFNSCSKLTTIYVSNKWNVDNVTESEEMFTDCINLPNYNSYKTKKTNAHYGKGGYLTLKK